MDRLTTKILDYNLSIFFLSPSSNNPQPLSPQAHLLIRLLIILLQFKMPNSYQNGAQRCFFKDADEASIIKLHESS
jgi:hypothetical protein